MHVSKFFSTLKRKLSPRSSNPSSPSAFVCHGQSSGDDDILDDIDFVPHSLDGFRLSNERIEKHLRGKSVSAPTDRKNSTVSSSSTTNSQTKKSWYSGLSPRGRKSQENTTQPSSLSNNNCTKRRSSLTEYFHRKKESPPIQPINYAVEIHITDCTEPSTNKQPSSNHQDNPLNAREAKQNNDTSLVSITPTLSHLHGNNESASSFDAFFEKYISATNTEDLPFSSSDEINNSNEIVESDACTQQSSANIHQQQVIGILGGDLVSTKNFVRKSSSQKQQEMQNKKATDEKKPKGHTPQPSFDSASSSLSADTEEALKRFGVVRISCEPLNSFTKLAKAIPNNNNR